MDKPFIGLFESGFNNLKYMQNKLIKSRYK